MKFKIHSLFQNNKYVLHTLSLVSRNVLKAQMKKNAGLSKCSNSKAEGDRKILIALLNLT